MKFTERKEFPYDPEVFQRKDTVTALRIYAEYIRKHSAHPAPKFFEVDRKSQNLDPIWHVPIGQRTQFTREILIPALNKFERPKWTQTKIGIVPQRFDRFILAHNILQELDYWPMRGDQVFWNGYRYMILNVVIEPEAYWQQTNVWMGIVVECTIPPEGDARPLLDQGHINVSEKPAGR